MPPPARNLGPLIAWPYDLSAFQWPEMNAERLTNALAESKTVTLDVLSYSHDELMVVLYEVFQSTGLPSELGFNNQKLQMFIWAIRSQGYYNNAYHCFEHACDVFLTLHAFLYMTDSLNGQRWSRLQVAASLFAAIIHDMEHPGFNNDFLIKTRAPVAITYNDRSVLENHHCAQGFRALLHPRLNFDEGLSMQDFNSFRATAVQLVLATDMSRHGEYMKLTADPLWPTGAFPLPNTSLIPAFARLFSTAFVFSYARSKNSQGSLMT
jgi:cAMP-specific phosphodiesterase 4/high affinity cAMP-specific and IBMX-insensitive 3',5'-cyclic phosphodiesterase 8